jgi:flagellar M-ring protein FliF
VTVSEWFSNLIAQFQALSAGRRLALVATGVGSLAFFFWLAGGATRADYRLLFRGLDEAEAVKVVEGLDAENIPYRIEEGGTAIFVPGSLVYEARIRVAGRGLPFGGSPGFEIFDRGGFGVTDFVQKVNFQRAVQGELGRSIEQLEAVERARVQIAVPERTAFARKGSRKAGASVVVRLRPSVDLSAEQVRGIVHLVASSVQYLDAADVAVVDSAGRLLAPLADLEAGPRAPAGALARQAGLEADLARRVEAILEPTVGMGRVVATVRADLDWTQAESTEERFDPDSQVARSEQRTTDSSEDASGASGIPGIRSNAPDGVAPGGGGTQQRASSTSETVNYEISKVVTRRVDPVGTLRRLDVAVLVDGKPVPGAGGEAAAEPIYTPWAEEDLERFESLAMRAVGFSADRGDQITVTSAPFRSIEIGEEEGFAIDPQLLALLGTALNYLGLVIALILFARLVGKPIISALTSQGGSVLAVRAGELEASLAGGQVPNVAVSAPPPSLSEQVGSVAENRGAESVKALRGWLDEG